MDKTTEYKMLVLTIAALVLLAAALLFLAAPVVAGSNFWELAPGDSLEVGCERGWVVDPLSDYRIVVYCPGDDLARPAGPRG
jgi:hypothetical protein